MTTVPTDLQILGTIYTTYYNTFKAFENESNKNDRISKVYVPVDIDLIANKLNVDDDIVFGRLYYHLDKKFRYSKSDGTLVPFFQNKIELSDKVDKHCVHFPYLASVLADLQYENQKFKAGNNLAKWSLVIAISSAIFSAIAMAF